MNLDRLKNAVSGSLKLWDSGEHQGALQLLDDSIAEAIEEGENSWVSALSHHAAILCGLKPDQRLVKHYYELSLTHNPENPMALYGLAKVALEGSEPQIAKEFATRCYRAILQGNDEVMKQGLLDLVLLHWPEVGK